MAIVDDFKDIASRMKEELKAKPELEEPYACDACAEVGWRYQPIYDDFDVCSFCGNPKGRPCP